MFATETQRIPETGTERTEHGTESLKYFVFQAIIKGEGKKPKRKQKHIKKPPKTETEVKFRTSKHKGLEQTDLIMLFVLQPEIKIILNKLTGLFSETSDIPPSKSLSGSILGKTAPTQVSLYI